MTPATSTSTPTFLGVYGVFFSCWSLASSEEQKKKEYRELVDPEDLPPDPSGPEGLSRRAEWPPRPRHTLAHWATLPVTTGRPARRPPHEASAAGLAARVSLLLMAPMLAALTLPRRRRTRSRLRTASSWPFRFRASAGVSCLAYGPACGILPGARRDGLRSLPSAIFAVSTRWCWCSCGTLRCPLDCPAAPCRRCAQARRHCWMPAPAGRRSTRATCSSCCPWNLSGNLDRGDIVLS